MSEGEVLWGHLRTPFHPLGSCLGFRDYSRILAYHKPVATLCGQGFPVCHPEQPEEMKRAEWVLCQAALTGTLANLDSGNMESILKPRLGKGHMLLECPMTNPRLAILSVPQCRTAPRARRTTLRLKASPDQAPWTQLILGE
jgi:hypothetical protein